MSAPLTLKQRLSFWRRRLHEWCGSDRYSWPGLEGLDRRLASWLDQDNGYFIEAGAHNGYDQSNTYHLERMRGWRGLLVEPHPALAARCRWERPASQVVQAALVGPDYVGEMIELQPAGLMSMVAGSWRDTAAWETRMAYARQVQQAESLPPFAVPARTLSALLDEAGAPAEIDFLSLDVEGFEVEALRGLDLSRHAPRFICVEARDAAAVTYALGTRYEQVALLTDNGHYVDALYRRR